MQNDWMLIRGHPDFLILHSAGLSMGGKRPVGVKPEVHGLSTGIVKKSKEKTNV
jgi:hypothetical protein